MNFDPVISELSDKGYAVLPAGFLSAVELAALNENFRELAATGRFRAAGVGKERNHQRLSSIRRDQICWFEPTRLQNGQEIFWSRLGELKDEINRQLFAGLWDLEGHFALYPPGGFYRRHLDRFASDDARTITVVFYLNENWQPEHGGELVIYDGSTEVIVEPRLGTLVIFRSEQIEHEVRESRAERRSFAGWFRRRTGGLIT